MTTAIIFFGLLYAVLVGWFLAGWLKLPEYSPSLSEGGKKTGIPFLSVVIPARNEAENIQPCLKSLLDQNLDFDTFEVLVVDDQSEDFTADKVQQFKNDHPELPLQLIKVPDEASEEFVAYKKQAIETGIREARGNWIVTTDADCVASRTWLLTMASFIHEQEPYFIAGPVQYKPGKSFFEAIQTLEFMSLIGIGAASISNNKPNMCNGANLAYRKDVFKEVNGFKGYDHLASGDDEFLLYKINMKYPEKVEFLKSKRALIFTQPLAKVSELLQQRKRWVSKGKAYTQWATVLIIYFVFFYHLAIILALLGMPLNLIPAVCFLILFGFKVVMEFLFLLPLSGFFEMSRMLIYYFPAALIYPFYVVFIAIYANFGAYNWKNRKVK